MKKKICISILVMLLSMFVFAAAAFADEGAPKIDTGDTAFVMISAALVFFMTPGLAFFYGGMVRKKSVLNTIMNVFFVIGIVSVQWVLFGYTLAFGHSKGGFIGGFDWLGLIGVGAVPNADYAPTIPHMAFVIFQLMFAIITPALITGAFAERMKFSAFAAFVLLWSTFVYDPLAHWVWGAGGWLRTMGALDFAGGNVIHISSGIAGLVAAIVLGKRKGYGTIPMLPHNLPMIAIGGGILWFGWFGFNAGSALGANGLAVSAFIATNTSAAAAVLSWAVMEWMHRGKPTLLGAVTGSVVGLVAITPAAGYVTPLSAVIIGLVVSPLCYFAISVLKAKFGYDDALDAFGCHGIGGIWGALATGLFATKSVNEAGADGLFYGNAMQFGIQFMSVVVTVAFSALLTFGILKVISLVTALRVTDEEELEGVDIAQHGEDAYPDFLINDTITL